MYKKQAQYRFLCMIFENKKISTVFYKRVFVFLFLYLALIQQGFSQRGVTLEAPSQVEAGEEFEIAFSVQNLEEKKFEAPNFEGFQFLGGPSVSSSSNIMMGNGGVRMTQTKTYSYYLKAGKPGKYKIGKAQVLTKDNQIAETKEFEITVVKPTNKPQARQPQNTNNGMPYDPFDPFSGGGIFDIFQQMQQQARGGQAPQTITPHRAEDVDLKKDVFAKIILNKNTAYVGEQITATVKIFTAVNAAGFEASKIPTFNGFWSQEVKIPENGNQKREIINGKEYITLEVKKVILFPTKPGVLEISPLDLKTVAIVPVRTQQAQRQPRNIFDLMDQMSGMAGGYEMQQIPYNFSTGAAKITVKPLPEKNKPADFSGAVGSFSFKAAPDKINCKTDDAINYKVRIEGTGNLPLIELPKPTISSDFEVYDPKINDNWSGTSDVLSGSKEGDNLIIPHMPGEYTIPSLSFSYFDLGKGDYATITAPESKLTITGAPSISSALVSNNKEEENVIGKDIHFIKKNTEEFPNENILGAPLYWSLSIAPFAALLFAFGYKLRNNALDSDVVYMGNKRATKLARKRLAAAKKHLDANQKESFYNETVRGIWGYLENKLRIEQAQLSREHISETLQQKGVSAQNIEGIVQVIDVCEMSLFSPVSSSEMKKTYEDAVLLITKLESEIKTA